MNGITPGFITPSAAGLLREFDGTAERNRRATEQRLRARSSKFPAKLTTKTFVPALGRWVYSWSRQSYDADGNRVDDPNPFAGTSTWMPAFAYGDGEIIQRFPHEVMLSLRGIRAAGDQVYEFPAYCACRAEGSGSGTGGGGGGGGGGGDGQPIQTACCPNPVEQTLFVTWVCPGCPQMDGAVTPITWNPGLFGWIFEGPHSGGIGVVLFLQCNPTTSTWSLVTFGVPGVGQDINNCTFSQATTAPSSFTCDPFSAEFDAVFRTYNVLFPCPCDGVPVTFIVTE